MGSLFERGHNLAFGKGWKTHEQRDRADTLKGMSRDQKRGQEIIQALTPLTNPNRLVL